MVLHIFFLLPLIIGILLTYVQYAEIARGCKTSVGRWCRLFAYGSVITAVMMIVLPVTLVGLVSLPGFDLVLSDALEENIAAGWIYVFLGLYIFPLSALSWLFGRAVEWGWALFTS